MLEFLISGLALGTAAGLSPGPLLALVVSQTLRYGPREGVKVSFAPLASDLPIILVATLVLSRLSGVGQMLGLISVAGGVFTGYLGYESLRWRGAGVDPEGAPRSFAKAVVLNLLNPHVYLFWGTVGSPLILKSGGVGAAVFLGSFYFCLIGSKVVVALATGRSRELLSGKGYRRTMQGLGMMLIAVALWLAWQGLRILVEGKQ